LYAEV
jgi:pyridoxamine 5'-phosphate oxidase